MGGGGLNVLLDPTVHPPTTVVGTLFLMIECISKFDGQIEAVYVCNLTRLVFLWYIHYSTHDMFIFNLREKF